MRNWRKIIEGLINCINNRFFDIKSLLIVYGCYSVFCCWWLDNKIFCFFNKNVSCFIYWGKFGNVLIEVMGEWFLLWYKLDSFIVVIILDNVLNMDIVVRVGGFELYNRCFVYILNLVF